MFLDLITFGLVGTWKEMKGGGVWLRYKYFHAVYKLLTYGLKILELKSVILYVS
jgi:hypothetical protein